MATQNKITEMIAAIKTIYPYYAKDSDVAILVKTWTILLKPYSDEIVELAFLRCFQKCKTPPTPADVIEQINFMEESNEPSDEELWAKFVRALRDVEKQMYYFQFTFVGENGKTQGQEAREKVSEIWDSLPERVKKYVGSKGELMRAAQNYSDEELKYEKTRFFKSLPTIKKREEYTELRLLLGNEKLLLGE